VPRVHITLNFFGRTIRLRTFNRSLRLAIRNCEYATFSNGGKSRKERKFSLTECEEEATRGGTPKKI